MRYLLALLIFFLTTADVFGWTLSFAPGLSVKNAIIYLILLALAARFVVRGGIRLVLPKVHLWFGVLIAYAILTWLVAGLLIHYKSYKLLSSGIELKAELLDNAILFAVYLYGTQSLMEAKFLLKCMLLAVAAANAVAIGNVAGLFHVGLTTVGTTGNLAGRVYGAFGHANETAALTACLLPAYIAVALSSAPVVRLFWASAAAVSATLMVMAGSRGAFVGLALATVLGSYICRRIISWRRAAVLAVTLAGIAVPVLALASIKFGSILAERVTEMILNPSTSSDERVYIWMPILDKMMANPVALITGFGWGAYDVMGFFYAPHNQYLSLWFELGIVGVASYLILIGQVVITARRAAETAPEETARYLIAFVYGIIAVSVAVFFTLIFKPWLYIWAYIGLTMRMAVIAPQPAKPSARKRAPWNGGDRSTTAAAHRPGPNRSAPQRSG